MFVRQRLAAMACTASVSLASILFAQDTVPALDIDANGTGLPQAERVIVTGSNIPTAEEVGPNPVDTYRRDDISRLGARTPSDFAQKIPAITGFGFNENNSDSTR